LHSSKRLVLKIHMKYIVVVVAVAIAIVGFLSFKKAPIEYIRHEETKEITVEVDALESKISAAIASSSTEIEARAKAAYENAKHQAEVEIKLSVTAAYRAELEKKEKELQKESKAY
jgi:hypothetical protein